MHYTMNIAGLNRDLPLCRVTDDLYIGAFVIFGDPELTTAAAKELLKLAPAYDYMITAESKGIPLVCSMARLSGKGRYVLARKSVKLYMRNVISFSVKSITTTAQQTLYLDGDDVAFLKGKRVLIVDDVISTGASLSAMENLVNKSGATVAGRMAVLAEGDAIGREDITVLGDLPLFTPSGTPMT